jgi:hypothetical protein
MMDSRFSFLTFPQRFDGVNLHLRVLIVPRLSASWTGNPLLPAIMNMPGPGDAAAAFADADLQLRAVAIDGLDRFPASGPIDFRKPLPEASGVAPDARGLFEELTAPGPGRFRITENPPRLADDAKPEIFIKKYLPRSYRQSFLFSGPRTRDAVTDDSYHCAIRDATEPNPAFRTTPDTVSWGQVYAYCLRHHQLARRLGLIREASFKVEGALFEKGGYLFVDLTPDSDYAAQTVADYTFLARYAARIPRLVPGTKRTLFAAVQFPVIFDDPSVPGPPPTPGNYDAVYIEAADYDDGFAKIVHATQPVSQHLLAEDGDGFTPLTDVGIRLGWDDEQILIWQNRQLKEDPTVPMKLGKRQRLDAPMGVFAYRIDARRHIAPGGHGDVAWKSLVHVRSRAPLVLGDIALGDPPQQLFAGELGVEVHPQQLDGNQATGQFWLPAYMAHWNGKSMVLPDEDAAEIFGTERADGERANLGRIYTSVGLDDIPLRYGHTYDLRVRLMDPTGGGPPVTERPINESPAPTATVPFKRHVVPEPVRMPGLQKFPDAPLDAFYPADAIVVNRPLLGYPSVVFTGKYADPIPLLKAAAAAAVGRESFGIPDPDVTRVRIDVEVRALRMDNLLSISGKDAYAHLYTTHRDFSEDFDAPRVIALDFREAPVLRFGDPNDLGDLGLTQAAIDGLSELPLPRARDIRLTVRAVAEPDSAYFAAGAHIGKAIQISVRRESEDEQNLFAKASAAKKIRGIYLRPDPPLLVDGEVKTLLFERTTGDTPGLVERLAQSIGIEHKGMTLVGRKGERVVFGCSRRIRHTLSPDNSSLTFAAKEDLVNHWVVALTLTIDRDWTWDALKHVSFDIFRSKRFRGDVEVDNNSGRPIGDWEVVPFASMQALHEPKREHTTLIFLDAVEPKSELTQAADPAQTRFPDIIDLEYRIEPRFQTAPIEPPAELLTLSLPVTTPPVQVPRIASAGIALSKYEHNATYSETTPRRRYLWLELDGPVLDPNDAYFIRFLAYAPDPLLSDNRIETYLAPEETPLPIDLEPIRLVTTDQPDDQAGLDAMVQMKQAGNSDRHFLLSLPPGVSEDSAEMFGFFTYELRVGHAHIWCTAQGRYGRALRATGVQHPAPTLYCTCHRNETELVVEAPYAQAVLKGSNITSDPPRTEIWALLYAQVKQADGKAWRNILLDDRALELIPRVRGYTIDAAGALYLSGAFENRDAPAHGAMRWRQDEIAPMLVDLGLPQDAPLSVLCVEMMPRVEGLSSRVEGGRAFSQPDIINASFQVMSGTTKPDQPNVADGPRPLSEALGHYRILRTSPLVAVPEVCPTG